MGRVRGNPTNLGKWSNRKGFAKVESVSEKGAQKESVGRGFGFELVEEQERRLANKEEVARLAT
ncbi:hypothetical protein DEO72_LG5g1671 [Vigna unguiculata]|uniref:Uncharacterized protein n=1 Tax=Vigna unguiculata TaxID=3917 RepID=A0A4D6M042_VIGUN|nr:hypothetical protein DEO72_LG5g1671 [Vigna unguiculata]